MPAVRILPDALVHDNHVIVASVRCAVSFHAWITVNRLGHGFVSGERVAWSANKVLKGAASIGVGGSPPRGHLSVTINVGDGPYITGHTRLA